MRRSSSTNVMDSGISREIGTDLAKVKIVAENIDAVLLAASVDLPALTEAITKATDFEGITVVAGTVASWNPDTKVLTVPAVKGDKGDDGEDLRITDVSYNGSGSFDWVFSDGTVYTTPDLRGSKGDKGDKGDVGDALGLVSIIPKADGSMVWTFTDGTTYTTPILKGEKGEKGDKGDKGDVGDDISFEGIIYQGNGRFLWKFSDGTTYITPNLQGPQGIPGAQGIRGEQGISVHHLKGTSTTDLEGDFGSFGEKDTYTFYGDPHETIVLGWFTIMNGISSIEDVESFGLMRRATYDKDDSGVVDDSERLGGLTPEEWKEIIDDKISEAGTVKVLADMPALLEAIKTEDDQQEPVKPFVSQFDNVIVQDGGDGYWKQFIVLAVEPTLQLLELTNGEALRRADVTVPFDTTAQTAPSAVNEVLAELGDVTTLDTLADTAVEAINEVLGDLGDVTQLTANETTAVDAINKNEEDLRQLEADLGDVDALTTTATTVVTAINELDAAIGDVTQLTSNAPDVVTAVNVNEEDIRQLEADVGDVVDLDTAASTVVEAINELKDIADNLDSDKYDKTGGLISGDVVISGNLYVNGTTTEINTEELTVVDNLITVNKGEAGPGVTAGTAGIIIDRGQETDYEFIFDEATDSFRIGEVGDTQAVATREDSPIDKGFAQWDSITRKFITLSEVSKPLAESEADATLSAWTPRRVWDAVKKWFEGVSGTKGRDILKRDAAADVRTDIELDNVTNDAQTKATIVPNTVPTPADILIGNDSGSYEVKSLTGDATITAAGVVSLTDSDTARSNLDVYSIGEVDALVDIKTTTVTAAYTTTDVQELLIVGALAANTIVSVAEITREVTVVDPASNLSTYTLSLDFGATNFQGQASTPLEIDTGYSTKVVRTDSANGFVITYHRPNDVI